MRKWRIEDSAELYNINRWGGAYFSVNKNGNVIVTPTPDSQPIDLKEVIEELQLRDVSTPVLLRFPQILSDRIETLSHCFAKAAEEYEYDGQNFL
ncbi:MAG: arginine decarboxylase, partial [Bacteroidota bacterium]